MDIELIINITEEIHRAQVGVWVAFYESKTEEWIRENVISIAYELPVFEFIIATAACIDITDKLRLYQIGNGWAIITLKTNQ